MIGTMESENGRLFWLVKTLTRFALIFRLSIFFKKKKFCIILFDCATDIV